MSDVFASLPDLADLNPWGSVEGSTFRCEYCRNVLPVQVVTRHTMNFLRSFVECHPHDAEGNQLHRYYHCWVSHLRPGASLPFPPGPVPKARPLRPLRRAVCTVTTCGDKRTSHECARGLCNKHCAIAGGCTVHAALSQAERAQLGLGSPVTTTSLKVSKLLAADSGSAPSSLVFPHTEEEERAQLNAALEASRVMAAGEAFHTRVRRQRSNSTDAQPAAKRARSTPYIYCQTDEEENEQLAAALELSSVLSQSSIAGSSTDTSGLGTSGISSGSTSQSRQSSTHSRSTSSAGALYVWNPITLAQIRTANSMLSSPSMDSLTSGCEDLDQKPPQIKIEPVMVAIDLTGED